MCKVTWCVHFNCTPLYSYATRPRNSAAALPRGKTAASDFERSSLAKVPLQGPEAAKVRILALLFGAETFSGIRLHLASLQVRASMIGREPAATASSRVLSSSGCTPKTASTSIHNDRSGQDIPRIPVRYFLDFAATLSAAEGDQLVWRQHVRLDYRLCHKPSLLLQ